MSGASPAAARASWWAAPVLTGRLVTLAPLCEQDAPQLLAAGDDPEVFRHLRVVPPRTGSDARSMVASHLAARDAGLRVPYVQRRPADAEVMGLTCLYEIDPGNRSLAIGHTWVGRRWQRTGVNTEAKLLLLGRAFDELGAVRVVWHTDVRNTGSQAAVERLGAVREGLLRKHRQRLDGTWRDTVQYAMTDDDWPRVRDRLRHRLEVGA